MHMSFINGVTREQLIQDIIWYVCKGNCGISQQLIHTEPVRLIIGDADERYEDPESEDDEDADAADAVEVEEESTAEDTEARATEVVSASQDSSADAVIATGDETVIDVEIITPQLYERRTVEVWFKSREVRVDPISMREIRSVESLADKVTDFDLKDDLHKLTWFIKNYLSALQHHIEQGNRDEIAHWLSCWQAAAQLLKQPDVKLPINTKDLHLLDMSCLDIYLPNGRSIMTTACRSTKRTLLESWLQDSYGMRYTPTKYALFTNFLDAVANLEDADACDAFYRQFISELQGADVRVIHEQPILTDADEDALDPQATDHINMHTLQLACYLQNIPAVKTLVRAGVQLRKFDVGTHLAYQHYWLNAPNYKYPEIILAINHDNLALFEALRPLYMPARFDQLVEQVLTYIILFDKPIFIQSLLDCYRISLDFEKLLEQALAAEDVPEGILDFLLCEHKQEFYFCDCTVMDLHAQNILQRCTNLSDANETRKYSKVLLNLLPFGCPSFYEYEARTSVIPIELQQGLYMAHEIQALVKSFARQYIRNVLSGRVRSMDDATMKIVQGNIYRTLYAHAEIFRKLQGLGCLDMFANLLATCHLADGSFMSCKIQQTARDLIVATELQAQRRAYQGPASNPESGPSEKRPRLTG